MVTQGYPEIEEFSVLRGGPFFKAMERTHLATPDNERLGRRALLFACLTWFPLLILSILEGTAVGGPITIPFLMSLSAAVRFLIAVPLFIIAEKFIESRLAETLRHFVHAEIIRNENMPQFRSALKRAWRLCESNLAEGLLLGLVLFLAFSGLRADRPISASTWQVLVSDSESKRTLAGWWYILISLPIYQFLLVRWLWKFLIWSSLLWRISKLDLRLYPTHPDLAAGLGFVGMCQAKFGMIILAGSLVVSSTLAESILFAGATLEQFQSLLVAFVSVILIFFLAPLLVFTPRLFKVRRIGLLEYGALATQYTRAFDKKWVRGEAPAAEPLIGSPDIQSLADLDNSFAIIRRMRPFAFNTTAIIGLLAPAAIPLTPLLLAEFPLSEILKKLFRLVF
jgi:hypothetical protein